MTSKRKSWCATVRPRNGLSEKTEKAVIKWLKKQDYYFACIEMEDEARHMHIQVWYAEAKPRKHITQALKRVQQRTIDEWDAAQAKVFSMGTKIAYSDWFDDYCMHNPEKKDEVNIVAENVPTSTVEYYPTVDEQAAVLAKAKAVDKKYHKLSELWVEWAKMKGKDTTPVRGVEGIGDVGAALSWMEFVGKRICVMRDRRVRRAVCDNLYQYLRGKECKSIYMTKEQYDAYTFINE